MIGPSGKKVLCSAGEPGPKFGFLNRSQKRLAAPAAVNATLRGGRCHPKAKAMSLRKLDGRHERQPLEAAARTWSSLYLRLCSQPVMVYGPPVTCQLWTVNRPDPVAELFCSTTVKDPLPAPSTCAEATIEEWPNVEVDP